MTKLTDLESILLSAAAQRDIGSLLPAPDAVSGASARLTKAIAGLLKRGFPEERETSDKLATHRIDGDVAYGLYITDAGNARSALPTMMRVALASPLLPPPSHWICPALPRPAPYWRCSAAMKGRRWPT